MKNKRRIYLDMKANLSLANTKLFLTGFTFLEIMIVLSVFSLLFGIVLYFLVVARDSLTITSTQISLQQDLRRCLIKMTEELSETSINYLRDENDEPLNSVQRDEEGEILKCLPEDQECVYHTIKFRKPMSWDSKGQISEWADYIIYNMTAGEIIRQEGIIQKTLLTNISLLPKESGHGYNRDPNSLGSGFERLSANRLKISLVAEREDYKGRVVRAELGGIVYLRN
jgi:prepilin-type N-terminal cleavage/methylation domain-containing protein